MIEFHRALRTAKTTKAQALQTVARIMISSAEHRHSFYWAGFILVGDDMSWARMTQHKLKLELEPTRFEFELQLAAADPSGFWLKAGKP